MTTVARDGARAEAWDSAPAEARARAHRGAGALRRLAPAALVVGAALTAFVWSPLAGGPAGAATAARVRIVVNGQPAATSSDAHPVRLDPNKPARVHILLTAGDSALHVTTVRFQGDVMALPLFSYDSTVDFTVPANATRSFTFEVSLTGIGSEATGLVDTSFTLLSPSGTALASEAAITEVNGSIVSLYGLFGLVVLLLTLTSLLFGLLAMARHRLPQNRWMRAVRFFVPGFGIGLVLIFTMSAFRVFDPGTSHWVTLLVIPSVIGFACGYLTPAPDEEEFDDYDPDVLIAQIMIVDEDPLEEEARTSRDRDRELVLSSVVRPSSVPATPSGGGGAPDSRATSGPASAAPAPDSRATTGPASAAPVPDSRATLDPKPAEPPAAPDGRSTIAPPPDSGDPAGGASPTAPT